MTDDGNWSPTLHDAYRAAELTGRPVGHGFIMVAADVPHGDTAIKRYRVYPRSETLPANARLPPAERVWYTIVSAGLPCDLMFDVEREFSGSVPPHYAAACIEQLLKSVTALAAAHGWGAFRTLVLASDKPSYMSFHVHVRFEGGRAFRTLAHMGRAAFAIIAHALAAAPDTMVYDKDGVPFSAIDPAVYNVNRNMRMPWNSKLQLTPGAPLKPTLEILTPAPGSLHERTAAGAERALVWDMALVVRDDTFAPLVLLVYEAETELSGFQGRTLSTYQLRDHEHDMPGAVGAPNANNRKRTEPLAPAVLSNDSSAGDSADVPVGAALAAIRGYLQMPPIPSFALGCGAVPKT